MSNHFHILLEVPERLREPLGDKAVVELLRGLSGMTEAGTVEQQLGWFRERGQADAAEALKARVMARMWEVSGFRKSLKGRFTQWYNRRHGRKGTLWEERFGRERDDAGGDGGVYRYEPAGGLGGGSQGLPVERIRRGLEVHSKRDRSLML